jgi:hypothetical protein
VNHRQAIQLFRRGILEVFSGRPPAGARFVEFIEDQLEGRLHLLLGITGDFPGKTLSIHSSTRISYKP